MSEAAVKQKGVLYLEKNRLQIYSTGKPSVLLFEIPAVIGHDIEIFSRETLEKQLTTFLTANAVPPTEYILILAQNVLFEKDFTPANPAEQKKFVESVPFEYVSSREFAIPNGIKIVTANSEFYSTFEDIFHNAGSSVEATVPYFAVNGRMTGLDQGSIGTALGQSAQLKQQSMNATNKPELVISNPVKERAEAIAAMKKKEAPKQNALIGVFVLLLGVLGFMVFRPAPSTKPAAQTPPIKIVLSPSPTPVPASEATGSAEISPTAKNALQIQIKYDTSMSASAKSIESSLLQAKFENIKLTDQGAIDMPVPLLVLPKGLSADLKKNITDIVKSTIKSISTQEAEAPATDVVLTIGR